MYYGTVWILVEIIPFFLENVTEIYGITEQFWNPNS